MIDIEFAWINGGHWYKTQVTPAQYAMVLNDGMLHGKTLAAARIWQHDVDGITGYLTYDFEAAKSGRYAFSYVEPLVE